MKYQDKGNRFEKEIQKISEFKVEIASQLFSLTKLVLYCNLIVQLGPRIKSKSKVWTKTEI